MSVALGCSDLNTINSISTDSLVVKGIIINLIN